MSYIFQSPAVPAMKLRHLLPLCFCLFSPLSSAAQEAPAAPASPEAICDALDASARDIMDEAREKLKNFMPDMGPNDCADPNYTKKEQREDKKKIRQLKKEAKKKYTDAQGRANKLKTLANRLKAIEKDGSNLDKADGRGMTALMLAASLNEKDAVQWLLDKGANPALTNKNGKTAADLCPDETLANLIREKTVPSAEQK